MRRSRRNFLRNSAAAVLALPVFSSPRALGKANSQSNSLQSTDTSTTAKNLPQMVEADGRLKLEFGDERMVMDGGLQPFMFATKTGTIVVQTQSPEKPFPSQRMHYACAMWTAVSRDTGRSWTKIPLQPGENGLNLEGGAVQLRDGTILALDTYITPGSRAGQGMGQLYESRDDWQTLQGPKDVEFDLPNIDFYASKDDGGRPHDAARLHRRILELPNGDLLTTFYGCLKGDKTPSTYCPTMMKTRVMLVRSTNKGNRWELVSTVAVDPVVGTEGFNEPVLARVGSGEHSGRLICFIRTGRDLYEAVSDDDGQTWSEPRTRVFGGIDIQRTELWIDMFRHVKGHAGKLLDESNPDELKGAVVDPDMIEMRNGMLVATFGVRIPQKACWPHCQHYWNGNYMAFSSDHGDTWSNVVRLTSGVPTTHYTSVVETAQDGELFVVYDHGSWGQKNRYVYGRTIQVEPKVG